MLRFYLCNSLIKESLLLSKPQRNPPNQQKNKIDYLEYKQMHRTLAGLDMVQCSRCFLFFCFCLFVCYDSGCLSFHLSLFNFWAHSSNPGKVTLLKSNSPHFRKLNRYQNHFFLFLWLFLPMHLPLHTHTHLMMKVRWNF